MIRRNLNKKQLTSVLNNVVNFMIPKEWEVVYPPGVKVYRGSLSIKLFTKMIGANRDSKLGYKTSKLSHRAILAGKLAGKADRANKIESVILDLNALFISTVRIRSISPKIQARAFQRILNKIGKLIRQ